MPARLYIYISLSFYLYTLQTRAQEARCLATGMALLLGYDVERSMKMRLHYGLRRPGRSLPSF